MRRKHRHATIRSEFHPLNESHLLESFHGRSFIWKLTEGDESWNPNAGTDVIYHSSSPTKDDDTFLREILGKPDMPPINQWIGDKVARDCPIDDNNTPKYDPRYVSRFAGITMEHLKVWQTLYSKYGKTQPGMRILILEGGTRCAREYCAELAYEQIAHTDKDILYLGSCDKRNNSTEPPLCLHAYSISTRAAEVFIFNIFPCLEPLAFQIAELCKRGKITWDVASMENFGDAYSGLFWQPLRL